jgi:anti-sigma factor ChrR (cupin superfamily)
MTEPSSTPSDLRKLIRTPDEKFRTYNRYGTTLPGVEWLPLSGGAEANKEVYLIRFDPGSRSHPHIHQGSEEFLVLEGELTDHDGAVFQSGDFVRFEPGSEHWSFSENGCTLLVILAGGTNRPLTTNGSNRAT